MKTSAEGFQQCYNAQTVVDAERQIIVAAHLGSAATDQGFMLPLLDGVQETFGVKPGAVLADAGYCNEEDLATLEERGIDGYVALGREGKERVDVDSETLPATHRMGEKLASTEGRGLYAKRKWLSEAPNGWIKEILGFRRFSFPGSGKGACRVGPRLPGVERQADGSVDDVLRHELGRPVLVDSTYGKPTSLISRPQHA